MLNTEKNKQQKSRLSIPCFALKQLLKNGRECHIEHAGENYNLRLTRNNKLILTK